MEWWCSLELAGAFGMGLWKNLRKGWETFSGCTGFKVGYETKISFWHDMWCGDMALKVAFPAFFDIASTKDASVIRTDLGDQAKAHMAVP
jgi:hypothetical protein